MATSIPVDEVSDLGNRWFIGHPIRVIYDYQMVGVWQKVRIFQMGSRRKAWQFKIH
jgi:hypothetical protein